MTCEKCKFGQTVCLSVSDMVEGCNQECNDYFLEKEWDVIDEKLTKIGDFGRYGGGPRPRTEGA